MRHAPHRLLLPVALGLALAGCDRYMELPQCSSHFKPGDLGRLVAEGAASVRDPDSRLLWYRCNAGERFANGQCLGEALRLGLADARAYAQEFSAASGRTWRLPTQREMATLRQDACVNPAINTQAFPGIRVESYWTSSRSPNGPGLGCTTYTYSGNAFCREPVESPRPFMLVLD